ncbi:Uncharacterised protein [Mycobacteroides abscessus subsp. abscessus]|nr:Uncharacterised protein [Mycobacteroides abscessus subsp. abscessus]
MNPGASRTLNSLELRSLPPTQAVELIEAKRGAAVRRAHRREVMRHAMTMSGRISGHDVGRQDGKASNQHSGSDAGL